MQTDTLNDIENPKNISDHIFSYYDKNSTGVIGTQEIAQMLQDCYKTIKPNYQPSQQDISQYFSILDRNKDGKVTIEDIEKLVFKFMVADNYEKYAQTSSKSNNHGFTIKQPFDSQQSQMQQYLDQATEMFQVYDEDNSGTIDYFELEKMMSDTYQRMGENYQPTHEEVQAYMQQVDTNQDGQISLQEYQQIIINSLEAKGIQ